jgi:hypothetical protein
MFASIFYCNDITHTLNERQVCAWDVGHSVTPLTRTLACAYHERDHVLGNCPGMAAAGGSTQPSGRVKHTAMATRQLPAEERLCLVPTAVLTCVWL